MTKPAQSIYAFQPAFAGSLQLSVSIQGAEDFSCDAALMWSVMSFGQSSSEALRSRAGYATLVNNCLSVTAIECSAFSAMNKFALSNGELSDLSIQLTCITNTFDQCIDMV